MLLVFADGSTKLLTMADKFSQIFTHQDDATGQIRNFFINILHEQISHPTVKTTTRRITAQFADVILTSRGIEPPRLASLSEQDLEKPVYYCAMPSKTYLLVDGTHRYYKRYLLKMPTINGIIFPEKVWRKSLIVKIIGSAPWQG